MPNRVGEPQHIGGSDRLPTWGIALSEDPSPEWRRQFLRYAQASGIFSGAQLTVASRMVVFEIERSALALACEKIDQWIAHANGELSAAPRVTTVLVVDDDA